MHKAPDAALPGRHDPAIFCLAATFGLASILQGYATAPTRNAPTPGADGPAKPPINKLSPGEQGRGLGSRRASL